MDDVITKYNANVIRFRSLYWYENKHVQALTEAWDQIVKDELPVLRERRSLMKLNLKKSCWRTSRLRLFMNGAHLNPRPVWRRVRPQLHP